MGELYYTVHGQQLDVFETFEQDKALYIDVGEIKGVGFALFRKDAFDHSLRNDQVDDFTLHLLSEAKNYILKNKVTAIDEEIILATIEKCKQKLTKNNVDTNQRTSSRLVRCSPKSPGISVTTSNNEIQNHHVDNRNSTPKPNFRARSNDRNSLPDNNFNKVGSAENWTPRRSLNLNHESGNAQRTNQGNRSFSGNNVNQERQEFRKPANYDTSQRGQKSTYYKSEPRQNQEFSKPGNFSRDRSYDRRRNFQREQNPETSKPGTFSRDDNSDRRGNFQREPYQNKQNRNFTSSNFKPRESNLKPEIENGEFTKPNLYNNTRRTLGENEQTSNSNVSSHNLRPPKSVQDNSNDFKPRESPNFKPETTAQIKNENFSRPPKSVLEEDKDLDSKTSQETPKPAEKVEFEKAQPKPVLEEKLPQSNLELGSVHKVQVSYAHPDKSNICWVQLQESLESFNEMMFQILEDEPKFPVESNVRKGQLVLGLYEDVWCRGEVISLNPTIVNFVDYGNQSEVTSIKPLPDNFKKLPAFAFQVEIKKVDVKLEDGLELTIEVKMCKDQVALVELVQDKPAVNIEKVNNPQVEEKPKQEIEEKPKQEVEEKPKQEVKEKGYFKLPKQLKSLANEKKVKLMEFRDGTLFVKTKECVEKSNELNAYIQKLDLSARTLSMVKEDQLVLANRHGMTGLCRAIVIKKISDTSVTVRYLDHPGSDNLMIKYLRNVDDYLAEFPITLLMFPKIDMLDNLKGKQLEFLSGLIEKSTTVTMLASDKSIDLKLKTGELLSEALQNVSKPKPEPIKEESEVKETEKSTSIPAKNNINETDERIMYDDMEWVKLEVQDYNLFCYYIKDASELVMALMDTKGEEYIGKLLGFNMEDTKPYAPQQYEMCMGYYQSAGDSEEIWYRVMILEINGDEYLVTSVDYGGEVTLKSNKLRKLPKELKEIPILGIRCELADVPSSNEINGKLTDLILPGEVYNVTVKGLNEDTFGYIVEIPAVRDELKSLGLI